MKKDLRNLDDLALAKEFENNHSLYESVRINIYFSIIEQQAKLLFKYTEKQLQFLNLFFDMDCSTVDDLIHIENSYTDLPF